MSLSDIEAVREVIEQYMHGSYHGDAQALRDIFLPEAIMSGYSQDKLLLGTPKPFFDHVEKDQPLSESGEPYQAEIVSIDIVGQVASAILKEDGFFGKKYTDFFHLLKQDGEWKIISKLYTTE